MSYEWLNAYLFAPLLCNAGATPVDSEPPVGHLPIHLPQLARIFGVLLWLWLMSFERYNKKVKDMVGNKNYPISSLTNAFLRDAAAQHHHWTFEKVCLGNPKSNAFIIGAGKLAAGYGRTQQGTPLASSQKPTLCL